MQRSDNPGSTTPTPEAADPQATSVPKPRPSLLPEGMQPGAEPPPQRSRAADPIERARRDRDPGRVKRIQKRDERARQRAGEARRKRLADLLQNVAITSAAIAVCAAPLAIGAVHLLAIAPIAIFALLGAACTIGRSLLTHRSVRIGVPAMVLLALAAASLLQALPLPTALLDAFAPQLAQWLSLAWGSAEQPAPAAAALALNPLEALRYGIGLLAAAAVALSATNATEDDERLGRLVYILPVLGAALVLIGGAQRVLNVDARLFFYLPDDLDGSPFFAASFVNPNHLGAFLGLASFVPLTLASSEEHRAERGVLALLAGVCVLGMFATLSGQALAAWLVGLLAIAALTWRRSGRSFTSTGARLGLLAVAACGVLAGWIALAPYVSPLLEQHQGVPTLLPNSLWEPARLAIGASPWLGLGEGGFADATRILGGESQTTRFAFANNSLLQAAATWGVPAAAAATLALGAFVAALGLRPAWRSKHRPLMAGLFASFVFLGVESLGSFSLNIPGVFIPAALLLGVAAGRSHGYASLLPSLKRHLLRRVRGEGASATSAEHLRPARSKRTPTQPLAVGALLLTLTAFALGGAFTLKSALTQTADAHLRDLAGAAAPLPEEVHTAVADAIRIHPTRSNTHLTAAVAYSRADEPQLAIDALDRAAFFNPSSPAPWILRARLYLKAQQRPQAREAYREAINRAASTRGPGRVKLAVEAVLQLKDPAEIAGALPADPALWDGLLKHLSTQTSSETVLVLAGALAQQHPDLRAIPDAWSARALARLGRWSEARDLAAKLIEAPDPSPSPFAVLAMEAAQRNAPRDARSYLKRGLDLYPEDAELHFLDAETLLVSHRDLGFQINDSAWVSTLQQHLRALRPLSIRDDQLRYRYFLLSARFLYTQGRVQSAIRDLRTAHRANPTRPEASLLLAELLLDEHVEAEALEIFQSLLQRFPEHPQADNFRAQIKRLQPLVENAQDDPLLPPPPEPDKEDPTL